MGKNRASVKKYSQVVAGIAALVSLALGTCTAEAASFLNSCTTYCHGAPPRDGARKGNPRFGSQSSAFAGNHKNHLSAAPSTNDCSICHAPVAGTGFGHQNNVIDMAVKLKGYSSATGRAKYDKGVFFNQTSIPNLTNATCSNVNCHFEKKTPVWGSAAFNVATDCNACHGAPPAGAATGTAGSHTRHDVYFPGTGNCQKCHPNSVSFVHATSAGRPLKVQGFLRNPLNTLEATATYTGSGNNYLPSQSAAQTFGTCTNLYCHSNSGPNATARTSAAPAWGGTALNCAACHADMSTLVNTAPNGSHYVHASTGYAAGGKFLCSDCHGAGYGASSITTATHVNQLVEVSFTGTIAPGTTYSKAAPITAGTAWGTCSTSKCHGSATTIPWGGTLWSTTDQCGKCHSSTAAGAITQAVPFYSTAYPAKVTLNTDAKVGAHTNHMTSQALGISASTACTDCHGTVTLTGATHMNGSTTFAWSALATKNGALVPAYNATTGQCTATYCHGNSMPGGDTTGSNKSPVWKDPNYLPATITTAACGTCHGFPPSTASGHPSVAAPAGFPVGTSCNCHANISTTGTTYATIFVNPALHINGILETPSGGHSFPFNGSLHLSAAGTTPWSGCTSCHNATATGVTYATWASTLRGNPPNCTTCHLNGLQAPSGTSSCWDCHGATATDGMPNGASFPNLAGSHTKHVVNQGMACSVCHTGAGNGTAGHGNSNAVAHTSADVTVASATGQFTFAWAGGTGKGTCSSVACHGTAEWGVTTFDCISCHSSVVTITKGPLANGTNTRRAVAAELKNSGSRSHKGTAVGSDATKWDCIVCHLEGNYATGAIDPAYHANGVIDFRDPDTGAQIKKVRWNGLSYAQNINDAGGRYVDTLANFTTARFSRDLSQVLENDPAWLRVASIQINLCLKCHDSNGATNSTSWTKNSAGTVVGTALRPFGLAVTSTATLYSVNGSITTGTSTAAGNSTGAVMNVASQFDPAVNAAYHPVVGRQNNGFATGARMKAPWGNSTKTGTTTFGANTVYGYLISCFDCHAPQGATGLLTGTVVAHGNGTTAITTPQMRAASMYTTSSTTTQNLCTMCHANAYGDGSASNHGTGSAFATGGGSMGSRMPICSNCHGSGTDTLGARAADAHGFNTLMDGSTTFTSGRRPYSFFRYPGNLVWPAAGGNCTQTGSGCTQSGTYSPGGVY